MLAKLKDISRKWFRKDTGEQEFPIPDEDKQHTPPAVLRHLLVIKDAMARGDKEEVGNRQRRLLKLGVEVPTKPSHVDELLRQYDATSINQ